MDRVTQLQMCVDELTEIMCNTIGVLQSKSEEDPDQDLPSLFSKMMGENCKKAFILIDSMPDPSIDTVKMNKEFDDLNKEYAESCHNLENAAKDAEHFLEELRTFKKKLSHKILEERGVKIIDS
ncbi:MAG: Mediator of RNA polymerase II transcription subunit 21 [Paramarteilia canceri]